MINILAILPSAKRISHQLRIRFHFHPILAAHVAQLVERVLGKDEVTSSILVVGSMRE